MLDVCFAICMKKISHDSCCEVMKGDVVMLKFHSEEVADVDEVYEVEDK